MRQILLMMLAAAGVAAGSAFAANTRAADTADQMPVFTNLVYWTDGTHDIADHANYREVAWGYRYYPGYAPYYYPGYSYASPYYGSYGVYPYSTPYYSGYPSYSSYPYYSTYPYYGYRYGPGLRIGGPRWGLSLGF